MLCDVDNFKSVNDVNGHGTGDLVLSEIARVLSHHGFAGRLGGDEFVLLCDACADGAEQAARAVLEDVVHAFVPGSIEGWLPGISIGVAVATHERDLDALLRAADAALYEAKRAGRRRFALAR
jgi:diguanylate cyclase (GGDEF)-like protein